MKRLAVLSVLAVLFSAACAFGAVKDFGKFSVNVPKGWKARTEKEGSRVTLMKGNMIMEIVLESRGGRSLEAIAKEIGKHYGSKDLEDIEDYYVFTYKEDGVRNFGRVSSPKKGMYLLVLMSPHDHDNDVMFDIEETIKVK